MLCYANHVCIRCTIFKMMLSRYKSNKLCSAISGRRQQWSRRQSCLCVFVHHTVCLCLFGAHSYMLVLIQISIHDSPKCSGLNSEFQKQRHDLTLFIDLGHHPAARQHHILYQLHRPCRLLGDIKHVFALYMIGSVAFTSHCSRACCGSMRCLLVEAGTACLKEK